MDFNVFNVVLLILDGISQPDPKNINNSWCCLCEIVMNISLMLLIIFCCCEESGQIDKKQDDAKA